MKKKLGTILSISLFFVLLTCSQSVNASMLDEGSIQNLNIPLVEEVNEEEVDAEYEEISVEHIEEVATISQACEDSSELVSEDETILEVTSQLDSEMVAESDDQLELEFNPMSEDDIENNTISESEITLESDNQFELRFAPMFASHIEPAVTPESESTSKSANKPLPEEAEYEVQTISGDLYLVNTKTNEIRKDNAWVEYNGKYYFPNAEGKLYHNQAITFGKGNLYYLNANGEKIANQIVEHRDNLYLLGSDGKSRTDNAWVDINGQHYFPNSEGRLYYNQWITFGPRRAHFMGDDGAALTGVRKVGENLHLFDERDLQRGVLRKDNAWVEYNGKHYFPNASGKLYHNQAITFGKGNLYYLNANGEKNSQSDCRTSR